MFHSVDRRDHRFRRSREEVALRVKAVDEIDALVGAEEAAALAAGRRKQ